MVINIKKTTFNVSRRNFTLEKPLFLTYVFHKVLKMYAWEPSYTNKVDNVREREMHYIRRQGFIQAVIDCLFMCTTYLVSNI